jgi:hypothetical protein
MVVGRDVAEIVVRRRRMRKGADAREVEGE